MTKLTLAVWVCLLAAEKPTEGIIHMLFRVRETKKRRTKGPISGRQDNAFGSCGSHEGNITALRKQTPITPEGFLSQSVRSGDEFSRPKTRLESDDVLVRTVFDQVIHAKSISVFLYETELGIVVASSSLKFAKRLYYCFGRSGSWVSGSVALKLEEGCWKWIDTRSIDGEKTTNDVYL